MTDWLVLWSRDPENPVKKIQVNKSNILYITLYEDCISIAFTTGDAIQYLFSEWEIAF